MGTGAPCRAFADRFPLREPELRRLSASDPRVGAICSDYEAAAAALRRWQAAGGDNDHRARDYARLLAELEAELLELLDRASGRPPAQDPPGDARNRK